MSTRHGNERNNEREQERDREQEREQEFKREQERERENERQAVMQALEAYGLAGEAAFEALTGGTANRNYVIRASGSTYMLRKRSAKYSGADWIDYEEQYLLHVGQKGLPVPVPLPAASGARRCAVGPDTFQLLPYMEGGAFDQGDARELAAAGAFLGQVHRAAADFRPSVGKSLPRYDDPAVTAEALRRAMRERGDKLAPSDRRTIELMLACAEQVLARLPDEMYRRLPHAVIHGDYHPANVAFRGGAVCALYDFDWISAQPRLRDIADLVVYFAAQRAERLDGSSIYSLNQGCSFDMDRAEEAVRAYVGSAGSPLSEAEAAALPDFMTARLLHSRVQALAKVPPERAIQVLVGAIEPSLTWIERNREAFVARIGRLGALYHSPDHAPLVMRRIHDSLNR